MIQELPEKYRPIMNFSLDEIHRKKNMMSPKADTRNTKIAMNMGYLPNLWDY